MNLSFETQEQRSAARFALKPLLESEDAATRRTAQIALAAVDITELTAMMISGFVTPHEVQAEIGRMNLPAFEPGDLDLISGLRF